MIKIIVAFILIASVPLIAEDANRATYEFVATGLEIPWDIAFLPDGDLLVTERKGRLKRLGKNEQVIEIENVYSEEEGGLLGIALDPNFQSTKWIYLYKTTKTDSEVFNQVVRYRYENGQLSQPTVLLDKIPSAPYHNGGRIAFGPDGLLYITTGDANKDYLAQDLQSLAGKILRIQSDGSIPQNNPFKNAIYSYGHRNPQGITWDHENHLYSTEHGRSGFLSGYDELNLILPGNNYGWPIIQGPERKEGMETPILQSGHETWAPASALYWNGSVFFGGLRGESLYEARVDKKPIELITHYKNKFGRIRTIVLGPDGNFYLTTSNRDGRGTPREEDDKIIKINPRKLHEYLE